MTTYKNNSITSALKSVEFTPQPKGNSTFFHVDSSRVAEMKEWLTSTEVGQQIIAETKIGDATKPGAETVLVAKGAKSEAELSKLMGARGEKLQLQIPEKPMNYWALRGGLSVVGQSLHLASAMFGAQPLENKDGKLLPQITKGNDLYNPALAQKAKELGAKNVYIRKPFALDVGIFALLNQTANVVNMIYGGQKEKGDNRERAVKGELNKTLGTDLRPGETLIPVSTKSSEALQEPKAPPTFMQKLDGFAKAYSVYFFEIGLRILGTSALIVPWKKDSLKAGLKILKEVPFKEGKISQAWLASSNYKKDPNYFRAGVTYMLGKLMSLSAKTPDPHDGKEPTAIDKLRTTYLFPAGTAVESVAALMMSHNAFFKKKWGFGNEKGLDITPRTDYLSGVGGLLFFSGFMSRLFAPFGAKEVDMKEVYAHAVDTLAKTPRDKLPELVARAAATLTEHFKDEKLEFGKIYNELQDGLNKYYDAQLTQPAQSAPAPTVAAPKPAEKAPVPKPDAPLQKRDLLARVVAPAESHAKGAKTPASETSMAMA